MLRHQFTEQQIAQEHVLEILPIVSEVNAISEELNKHRSFEVVLLSAAAQEYGTNTGPRWDMPVLTYGK